MYITLQYLVNISSISIQHRKTKYLKKYTNKTCLSNKHYDYRSLFANIPWLVTFENFMLFLEFTLYTLNRVLRVINIRVI